MRESKIEKAVKAWAKAHDILPIKNTPMGSGGWPDDWFLHYGGRVCAIEFKAPGERPRPLQELRIKELRRRDFPVEVIDDIQQGIAFLTRELLDGSQLSQRTKEVGPQILSGDRRGPGGQSSVRGVPTPARHGQDDDHVRDSEHPAREASDP